MRPALLFAALLLTAASAFPANPKPVPSTVLVELFTSEGCSSCPPADALLAHLSHEQPVPGAEIIVLGEHVDYWDRLGWRDRFSSAQLTARQGQYSTGFHLDSVYTPQMVVDGKVQFVGNDQAQALRAITAAARAPRLFLTLSTPVIDGRRLSAAVSAPAPTSPADLYAALVEPMAATQVRAGENSGHTLQHVAVVRSLTRIGSTRSLHSGPLAFTLTAPEASDPAKLQVVVFAQSTTLAGLGPILGSATTAPPGK